MTLSLGSRQHRKSMLPTPRLSSRISSRRAVSGDTSRIARRVPSPLLATPHNKGSTAQQARVPQPEANCKLSLPKLLTSTRQAGSPSRIPALLGQTSCCPTPEQSDASSSITSTTRPEVKKADAQDPTPPPPSAGLPKDEQRLNSQEGRTVPTQHQEPETRNPAAASSARPQHPTTRRRASTAFAAGFSRIGNTSSGDGAGAAGALTRKKSPFTTSVSGKENRQPQLRTTRVLAPPVTPPVTAVSSVPPRSIRRTVAVFVAQPSRGSFRESHHPRPLVVVKKRTPHAHDAPTAGSPRGDPRTRSAAAAAAGEPSAPPLGFSAGIKALMEDVDCFAREWTEIFDELSTGGANGPEGGSRPSKLDSFTRIHPSVQPESAGTCQADGPAMEKRTHKLLLPAPSGSAAGSVSTLQASPLVSTAGEMIHVDVKPVSLARWQHRENTILKDASVDDKSVSDHTPPFPTAARYSSLL